MTPQILNMQPAATDEGKLTNFPENSLDDRDLTVMTGEDPVSEMAYVLPAAKQSCAVREMMIDGELC